MELSCLNLIFPFLPSLCHSSNIPKTPPLLRMSTVPKKFNTIKRLRAVVSTDCGSCGAELLEMDEWSEMLEWGEKCRGSSSGIVELLECLEREAIMGEDEGREAVDYNRRAQIFDKSGRVFQALKHQAEDDNVQKERDEDNAQSGLD